VPSPRSEHPCSACARFLTAETPGVPARGRKVALWTASNPPGVHSNYFTLGYRTTTHPGYTRSMVTHQPRRSASAALREVRPADVRADAYSESSRPNERLESGGDPKLPWPRALRLAIFISGAFWLIVAGIWAYLRAG